jgi:hypothetical protein
MKLLAIRLGCLKTTTKSLVTRGNATSPPLRHGTQSIPQYVPTVSVGTIPVLLTTTHRYDYFQFIAIRQLLRGKQTARHDFAIALQGNALAGQAHFFDECGNAGGIGKSARCAVNADGNHL